jgi:tetratricopeptide (TPR) repeat protein
MLKTIPFLLFAGLLIGQDKPEGTSLLGVPLRSEKDTEGKIAAADAELAKTPGKLEALLKTGQARDAFLQYGASIGIYTKAIQAFPNDPRPYRWRGHRQISLRKFDLAIVDLEKARSLAPSSFEAAYYLGLAYYFSQRYGDAANEFARCVNMAGKPDEFAKSLLPGMVSCATMPQMPEYLVGLADWHYRALRRAGRSGEAKELLSSIKDGLMLRSNESNYRDLRYFQGKLSEKDLLETQGIAYTNAASGVALNHLLGGRVGEGCTLLRKLSRDPNWSAFGVIAAEVELTKESRAACALFK